MDSSPNNPTHVAVCPSPGVGHLTPCLRVASMLASSSYGVNFKVTLVIIRPCLSSAESNLITTFLSTHPHITSYDFNLISDDPNHHSIPTNIDPFLRHYIASSHASHRLVHHLTTFSPPLSAVFSDFILSSGLNRPLAHLGIGTFTIITTSALFLCFLASVPFTNNTFTHLDIPESDLPPQFLDPSNPFRQLLETNSRSLNYAKGVMVNTFEFLESKSLANLQSGKVVSDLPPVYPIGPLWSYSTSEYSDCYYMKWLDEQPRKSVVYVNFGSRTPLSKEQIKEVGEGIEKSGMRFLWVVKMSVVDKDDKGEVEDVLGEGFLERNKTKGIVIKGWVNQDAVLDHQSIGGFVSHCGWNSIMETTMRGIPMVTWPQHGDQRVNALVVEEVGLGIKENLWGWGKERLIKGDEIGKKIKEMMMNERLKESARKVGEEATKAWDVDGSSTKMFQRIVFLCKNSNSEKQ